MNSKAACLCRFLLKILFTYLDDEHGLVSGDASGYRRSDSSEVGDA
jgi:hypothetical protein